ncbi:cell division protein FtsQ/DivIB [Streptococcus parauberis]|uniref:cell division protein FtsQ/DivIB n=2 Tax=Streptococcus parauberis TaxID=1348 RepID=UPI0002B93818|nr:cell division protein FtsQ/DivIB [Streptococcus parauberis]EMF50249.1 Cell division protein [Streptococcus parauberis KRS-02109]UWM86415.1 FtsQ-type POTRA domain-containing protein [Streptococcus parauberis]UWM88386.1 FtsQ-type POTRA domain-containing protein [Streptococcus parauberis]UWM90039.1 FtsQ-type POTRA domain-containing protein [Streptococcus parauberis]GAJ61535.1 cell division protein [Streptococcus parauberis]
MAKNKKKTPNEPVVLTEWQKRNLEFIEKKKKEAKEDEALREKLRIEKKEQIQQVEKKLESSNETEVTETEEVVESPEKNQKKQKLHKEKKSKTKRQIALIKALPVLLISFLILFISVFLMTPFSKIKDFKADGNSHTSLNSLIKQSDIRDSDYIFTVIKSASKFESNITKTNPWVKDVSIKYSFFNHFTFKVKEYKIIAYAQEKTGFQPILENGVRVKVVKESELPKEYLIINLTNENDIQNLVKTLTKLPEKIVTNIKSVSPANSKSTSDLIVIEMHDGNTVRVPQSQLETKMPYYLKIKKKLKEKSIIDMEVGIYSTTAEIEAQPVKKVDANADANKKEKTQSTDTSNSSSQTASSSQDTTTETSSEAEAPAPVETQIPQ